MKRFVAIAMMLAMLLSVCVIGLAEVPETGVLNEILSSGVLRVGTTGDYQPMSYLDPETETYVGFDTELTEDLAAALGVKIEYVKTSWPTLMEDTLAGKFDLAICGITVTDARKEQALMSDGYLDNGKTVLCRAEDADRYTSLEAINQPDVRVMENPGGLNEKFARENLPDASLIIHDVNQEIPGLVASGEADVMITEIMEAGFYVGQDDRLAAPLIFEPFTRNQLGVLMPNGSDDLLDFVNQFLADEKDTGRLDELAEKDIYRYIQSEEELQTAAGSPQNNIIPIQGKTREAAEEEESIPLWSADSPAMRSIVSYVREITDETSEKYVPAEQRIAVFDLDGTLTGERYPGASTKVMLCYRMVEEGAKEEDVDAVKAIEEAIRDHKQLDSLISSSTAKTSEYFAGSPLEEYQAYIREFLDRPVAGFTGMTYRTRFFLPMVELVKYLTEHGVQVYICSGSERFFVREQIAEALGQWIPPYRVIGTTFTLAAEKQGDADGSKYKYASDDRVVLAGGVLFKTLAMNKISAIQNEIGIVPTMVFGNSSGDYAMGEYCVQHGGKTFILLCDDLERDYGDTDVAEKCAEECREFGFETVSMRDEFETIYGDTVEKEEEALEEDAA